MAIPIKELGKILRNEFSEELEQEMIKNAPMIEYMSSLAQPWYKRILLKLKGWLKERQ